MPTIPSGMQQIRARLLQAPVTLSQTLPGPHLAQTSPGPPVVPRPWELELGFPPCFPSSELESCQGYGALTSTRPRLAVLSVGWRHWGCKDSSEGLQGGGSWISPSSWNSQGVSEANCAFNYSWWHFEFVLKATSEPPLLSQLLCSWVWRIWTAGPEDKTGIMPFSSRAEPQHPGTWGIS